MKLTVLMENTAPEGCGLAAEHGLSLYIRHRGRTLLLDAGSSGRFADNAQALGLDLEAVDAVVLSHGHYDHGDGLRRFFQLNHRAPVYVRKGSDGAYFAGGPEGLRYIGVHREIWSENRSRFVEAEGLFPLMEGAWLVPETVHCPDFAGQAGDLLFKRGEDNFVPDDYRHEHSLVLEGRRGLVLLNSCSHGGIVNIVRSVLDQFPGRQVQAVVGGFHMFGRGESGMNCSRDYVVRVADALKDLGVEQVHTGHCTGEPALAILRECLGDRCCALTTGQVLEF